MAEDRVSSFFRKPGISEFKPLFLLSIVDTVGIIVMMTAIYGLSKIPNLLSKIAYFWYSCWSLSCESLSSGGSTRVTCI